MSDAIDWIKFAREDLRVAKWTLAEKIYNQTCFHAQQCVEKSLKALLISLKIAPPKSHQMSLLLGLVPITLFANLRVEILTLDRFYIPTRYPDAIPGSLPQGLPNEADAKEAFQIANQVLKEVEKHLGL